MTKVKDIQLTDCREHFRYLDSQNHLWMVTQHNTGITLIWKDYLLVDYRAFLFTYGDPNRLWIFGIDKRTEAPIYISYGYTSFSSKTDAWVCRVTYPNSCHLYKSDRKGKSPEDGLDWALSLCSEYRFARQLF